MIAVADSVFIYGTYVVTGVVLGALTLSIIRRGRALADQVDDDDKYWA